MHATVDRHGVWTPVPDNAERDPTGRDAHAPGAKLDAGKMRPSLVLGGFSRALAEVTKVGTYGANKYSDNGWMEVPNGLARYSDAQLRHQLSEMSGERCDKDTGLLHAAHAAWNALARLELLVRDAAEPKLSGEAKQLQVSDMEVVLSSALPPSCITSAEIRRASDRHDQALGIHGLSFTDARSSTTIGGPDTRLPFPINLVGGAGR
ncbi:dATP/dGTP diphosphohydrolase domain-containing protein [Roseococcus sp.]|uniref:dATP/dGTP diphosphohydrolase domain-containing protein n=1 Tax=Roseococcus sp. TaxID=2109646 RepID=UPI003BA92A53